MQFFKKIFPNTVKMININEKVFLFSNRQKTKKKYEIKINLFWVAIKKNKIKCSICTTIF